jgi:hypothetical protein
MQYEKRLKIHQMDAIRAFLSGDLNEDIYIWNNLQDMFRKAKRS